MPRILRILILVVLAPIAIVVWGTVVFAMDRASNSGEILGEVNVAGVELGGLEEYEARLALLELEYELASQPIDVVVEGTTYELYPYEVGYSLDREDMLAAALANGRTGGLRSQFGWWLGHFAGDDATVEVKASVDTTLLDPYFDRWQEEAIAAPPFEGGVVVENGELVGLYPRAGVGIDREATAQLIEAALLDPSRPTVTALTNTIEPVTSPSVIDDAVERAQGLIETSVRLSRVNPAASIEFPVSVLQQALQTDVVGDSEISIVLSFAPEPLIDFLDPRRASLEFPAVDAEIVILSNDTPSIIPGRNSMVIDDDALPGAVMAAATSITRSAALPYGEGEEPELTTQEAEDLGIKELLYRATTFYPCCGDQTNLNRINNIHLIADAVDGAIVLPGETFSLNEHVGQRTVEKGYAEAGAIIGDEVECCDHPENIGGGVSQFTTTLYNAIFFSGLEDVEHTPHTLYFARYPEGREATLGYPSPDLKFRNSTENAIYIRTWHTDDSVSVEFYGDNGGITVTSRLSERCCFTEPFDSYEPDPDLNPDEEKETDPGSAGWTVTVYRDIEYPDGRIETQEWVWTYRPFPRKISVHPCRLPTDHEDYDPSIQCPSPIPPLFGLSEADARAALNALGLVMEIGEPWIVEDPAAVGTVRWASHGEGQYLAPGSVVTVRLGALASGGEEGGSEGG
jgi:vancomycin resistance protein YoaR